MSYSVVPPFVIMMSMWKPTVSWRRLKLVVLDRGNKDDKGLETETWYDLALLYLGKIYEAKGLRKEALGAFFRALDLDPKHVPSLISTATVLQQLGDRPLPSIRCFLTDALQLDRTNHVAWFNLGLLYKEEGGRSAAEAAECFQAAAFLKETAPSEPFR
ncbi:no pollen germination related 2 [Zea mays]|uniref:No pollen germination related 2 n=1 Tax=Zea mays TaxID=4577 RepID=A0A1D6KTP7_MAIZE|nr:no pollen germination related 2 [Zea mays]